MRTTPPERPPAVTVAVCTFRRNDKLATLVRRVDALVAAEVPGGSVRMLVVDDSPELGADALVAGLRDEVTLQLEYRASATGDIAVARNLALASGSVGSDFVACLDDDCVPQRGWLRELLRVANDLHADVIVGHRQFIAPPDSPRWLHAEPFLAENLQYADGSVPNRGNTANMLVRSSWLQSSHVSFRAEMGTVGGEDMVFFSDAAKVGGNIRFAAASICDEPCDGQRATFRYQFWRQVWLGNNEAVINWVTHGATRVRLVARGVKRVLLGVTHPLVRVVSRRSPQVRWSLGLIGRGIGLLLGVVGLRLRHRS